MDSFRDLLGFRRTDNSAESALRWLNNIGGMGDDRIVKRVCVVVVQFAAKVGD